MTAHRATLTVEITVWGPGTGTVSDARMGFIVAARKVGHAQTNAHRARMIPARQARLFALIAMWDVRSVPALIVISVRNV